MASQPPSPIAQPQVSYTCSFCNTKQTSQDVLIKHGKDEKRTTEGLKEGTSHHNPPTFFLQTIYFVLKFGENLIVLLILFVYYNIQDIVSSDSTNTRFSTFPTVLGLTLAIGSFITWGSHVAYYRFHGHPWKSANGPLVNLFDCGNNKSDKGHEKRPREVKFDIYLLGKHVPVGNKQEQRGEKEDVKAT